MSSQSFFSDTIGIVGIGLIGSSIARAIKEKKLAQKIYLYDSSKDHCDQALELGIVDHICDSVSELTENCSFIFLCIPPGQFLDLGCKIGPLLKEGTILTDVGSVKKSIINQLTPYLKKNVYFVPGHPVAGTENSGPTAGFSSLFENRWCILTPPNDLTKEEEKAYDYVQAFWESLGTNVKRMSPEKHDLILGITSHLPHLIAYTIVGTAVDLEEDIKHDVIKFSAGGFRDFTRIAASDPTMWRDIFLGNKEAIIEILGRFTEDLTELQKAVRRGHGHQLFDFFSKTRKVRKEVIESGQSQ